MQQQYKRLLTAALSLLLTCPAIQLCAAQELITNGGFENGTTGWSIWIPDESKSANCRFEVSTDSPHSGVNCVHLQADDFARFCIGTSAIPVQAGDRYRVTAWVRAEAAAQMRPQSHGLPPAAGFVIRLNLRQGDADAAGGHLFIGLGNQVLRDTPAEWTKDLPKEWTKVEAVVEIPTGVDAVLPALFMWWAKGTISVDDFSVEGHRLGHWGTGARLECSGRHGTESTT